MTIWVDAQLSPAIAPWIIQYAIVKDFEHNIAGSFGAFANRRDVGGD